MSAVHQMHGLAAGAIGADWPALREDEVHALLRHFGLPTSAHALEWHSPRPFSAAARVRTGGGPVFVKRHHRRLRDARTLAEEHRFIEYLRGRGAPVPELLRDRTGNSVLELGAWTYEVQRAAAGEDLYRDAQSWTAFAATAHAGAAGRALAALHRAAAGHAAAPRSTTLLVANFRLFGQDDPLQALAQDLPRRPALAAWLRERDWQADLRAHLLPWHAQAWPLLQRQAPLWTHGDWHASNLLWRGDGTEVSGVFDFGLSDRTFALFDLATAIERNLVPWLELDDGGRAVAELDQLDALLDGYASVLPLDAAQLRALAALLPLVHADFALSEVEYYAGITGSAAHAAIAYGRYLLGHADWFGGDEGQRLLRHLRRRAEAAP
ncbi:phosphotransferase [Stenotrophomonas sp. MMGLT7]|uniref:phosphotransferase enzyme family protein n=1 Tax=Stenotrophomonas sp. MMGLT7 TaxID=2901227 RepID=UPI001E5EE09F|nr:phosphotransferase [Stenotrophomonas sp. MMGLT7]MCD7099999.1 phosphotransferase [Stenotrophomonas sp. MMGLT7]